MNKILGTNWNRRNPQTSRESRRRPPVTWLCSECWLAERPKQLITCGRFTDTRPDLSGPYVRTQMLIGQVRAAKEESQNSFWIHAPAQDNPAEIGRAHV